MAARAGLPWTACWPAGPTWSALAALVAGARLVVCGDTGVGHLATAYRTPSVLLFGPTPPARWGPPRGRAEHAVLWRGREPGDPLGDATGPGAARAAPADVLAAADGAALQGSDPEVSGAAAAAS